MARADEFPEFEKGFGDNQGMTAADKAETELDRLKIGGTFWNEFQYLQLNPAAATGDTLADPSTLWVYLDSHLKNDIRAYGRIKLVYDPTAGSPNPLSGLVSPKYSSDLEELKLNFNVQKKVFFTVGKQKIKWGSGQFWNPTDFLNSQFRNFLYLQDLRSGVSLIKTHVPVGSSNFYLVNELDHASRVADITHAVRAEVPVWKGEVALSAAVKRGTEPKLGVDVSTAVGDFDAYGEFAYSAGNDATFFGLTGPFTDPTRKTTDWVAGLSYEMPYGDNDSIILAAEYYHNELGYASVASYPLVFAGGGYQPFHLGREYGMFMVQLPNPGSWNHFTLSLFNLGNLSDHSFMTRADALFIVMSDLKIDVAAGVHYGAGDGEFKIGDQRLDAEVRLMVDF
ncbi:MAG TPA: hypothetical protein VL588_07600 [Bdellovibrionota bacterium]|nr:hypothetical protein [Bdellovibrionota bacterium]